MKTCLPFLADWSHRHNSIVKMTLNFDVARCSLPSSPSRLQPPNPTAPSIFWKKFPWQPSHYVRPSLSLNAWVMNISQLGVSGPLEQGCQGGKLPGNHECVEVTELLRKHWSSGKASCLVLEISSLNRLLHLFICSYATRKVSAELSSQGIEVAFIWCQMFILSLKEVLGNVKVKLDLESGDFVVQIFVCHLIRFVLVTLCVWVCIIWMEIQQDLLTSCGLC